MANARRRAAVVAAALLVVAVLGVRGAAAQGAAGEVEVRVAAQRLADGRTEFALQERESDGSWAARRLPSARFFPANADVGRWLSSSPLTVEAQPDSMLTATAEAGVEVRVAAQLLADGRMEFALQEREAGGSWAERRLPSARFFPANADVGRWLSSSALTVRVFEAAPAPTPTPTPTATPTPAPTPPAAPRECSTEAVAGRVLGSIALVSTSRGSGTAFYIGDSEWITAEHVVTGETSVRLTNATLDVTARVVGVRADVDLAVLSAASGASALSWGTLPRLGAATLVVGYGVGQQSLTAGMTQGIVSEHYTEDGQTFIRTDAPANPGNSGGPLLDLCGEVTGVILSKLVGEAIEGVAYALAADSVQALLPSLRAGTSGSSSAPPTPDASALTIKSFCTYTSSEDLDVDECHSRSTSLDAGHGHWNLWAEGVVDFAEVVYRVDQGAGFVQADVSDALLALGTGCYELEIAEDGISTRWSLPYEFCIANSVPTPTVPTVPTGLRLTKIDIPFWPDDIRVDWNAVSGATWYEVYHHAAGTEFDYEATVTSTYYLDEWPNILYYNSYIVRACNASGCSDFSARVTQQ